jgi:DNA-binding NarL/FixJ family response regulator
MRGIVLADDHDRVREGVKALLQDEGFAVVGEASNGALALELAAAFRPAIAILDVSMPVLSGIDAADQMRAVSPATKTILLTSHADDEYVRRAARAGVVGYVLKTKVGVELIEAIRHVLCGGIYLGSGISRAAFQAEGGDPS